ncbi:hypothetical protein BDN72DRAFT_856746 [Pluteus cervinus]|uniref:Uncharacterized protein n=1 Tax=Pluteus cervinus TaxID=181527 RepID=A0ACD3AXE3_9AGAR|nr:hypothetical protein BDN72DRAFT_856746 [Pluteus cervinus]
MPWNRGAKGRHRKLRHYRLILEYIERSIRNFRNVRELVTVIRDAFIAFDDAFQIAHILHRDISIGNIMIRETNGTITGVLLDWDLCKDLTGPSSSNRHIERTGTWAFMSGSLAAGATVHTREDDVESFYHVLNYLASLFLQHTVEMDTLSLFIYNNFIQRIIRDDGFPAPSRSKLDFVKGGSVAGGSVAVAASNPRIFSILRALAYLFAARYAEIEVPPYFNLTPQDVQERLLSAQNLRQEKLDTLQEHRWLSDFLTTELNNDQGWDEAADPVDREAEFWKALQSTTSSLPAKRSMTAHNRKSKSSRSSAHSQASQSAAEVVDEGAAAENDGAGDSLIPSHNATTGKKDMQLEIEDEDDVVGPMPVNTFFERFLPNYKLSDNQKPGQNRFREFLQHAREDTLYNLWIDILQDYCGTRLTQVNTSNSLGPNLGASDKMEPDITVYHGPSKASNTTRCDPYTAELFIEFKFHNEDDPFSDTLPGFIQHTASGAKTLGQITSYATAHQAAQFRTHIFSLLVFPTFARFLRWDRSGVIVTERVPLAESLHVYDFMWRLGHADPATRGIDDQYRFQDKQLAVFGVQKLTSRPPIELTAKIRAPNNDERKKDMQSEIEDNVVGPMPVDIFFERFLPDNKLPDDQKPERNRFNELLGHKQEEALYDPWASHIDILRDCCGTQLTQVNTSNSLGPEGRDQMKPDITVYHGSSNATGCDPYTAELFIEFKFHDADDPFNDNATSFIHQSDKGAQTLGQITSYATAHQAAQFRTHIFSLLVFPTFARFLRWDRSGVVVTERVYLTRSLHVYDFMWRLGHADPAARGIDESVQQPTLTPDEETRVRLALFEPKDRDSPLAQVTIDGKRYVFAAHPSDSTSSPVGRSTRRFMAYALDIAKPGLVFLKDTWRILSCLPEHETYKKLEAQKVRNIAQCIVGQDVTLSLGTLDSRFHDTQTGIYVDEPWNKGSNSFQPFRHYRLVLEYIKHGLSGFRNVRELVIVIRDAFIGFPGSDLMDCNPRIQKILTHLSSVLKLRYLQPPSEDEDEDREETGRLPSSLRTLDEPYWLSNYLTKELAKSRWDVYSDPVQDREEQLQKELKDLTRSIPSRRSSETCTQSGGSKRSRMSTSHRHVNQWIREVGDAGAEVEVDQDEIAQIRDGAGSLARPMIPLPKPKAFPPQP